MFDGCLLYEVSGCSVCLPGGFMVPGSKNCTIKTLNCKAFGNNGLCTECFSGYEVNNGRCIDNTSSCAALNYDIGVCR